MGLIIISYFLWTYTVVTCRLFKLTFPGSKFGSDSDGDAQCEDAESSDVKKLNEQPVNKDDKSYDPNK